MLRLSCFFIVALVGFSAHTFELNFSEKTEISNEKLIEKFPSKKIGVFDPFQEEDVTYKGVSLKDILNQYAGDWESWEYLEVVCADGYKPRLKVSDIKKFDIYIAHKRSDARPMGFYHETKGFVSFKPFLLVWDNKKHSELLARRQEGWAWSVVGLQKPAVKDPFDALAPKKYSKSSAQYLGYELFVKDCIKCHSLNSIGGELGPELNSPINITEYFKKDFLLQWIKNPFSIRKNAKMPGFPQYSEKDLNNLYQYLKYMKEVK